MLRRHGNNPAFLFQNLQIPVNRAQTNPVVRMSASRSRYAGIYLLRRRMLQGMNSIKNHIPLSRIPSAKIHSLY
jgi:hypothetical protein